MPLLSLHFSGMSEASSFIEFFSEGNVFSTGQTLYQVKHGMLSEYLRQQLKSPMLKIKAA